MARNVSVNCPAIPLMGQEAALRFVKIQGRENVCELFRYTLDLKTPDELNPVFLPAGSLELKSFIGQEISVEFYTGKMSRAKRQINALISNAGIVRSEGRHLVYRLTLRPWLWLATRTADFKIFQDKSVVEILDEVLKDYPFPVKKALQNEYPLRDYQVQHGESDFDFIQRLTQEWGIYWYVEHAEGRQRLVLCDHPGAHTPWPGYEELLMKREDQELEDDEHVAEFVLSESLTSGVYVTDDYDFIKPRASLSAVSKQPREAQYAEAEVYAWPGDYLKADEGNERARIRMEERRGPGLTGQGQGALRGVAAGRTFKLANHAYPPANQEYLVLGTEFELEETAAESGFQEYHYRTGFLVRPLKEPYRPRVTMVKPHTHGPQTAVITGPAGQEIWTDKYGRVKVQFHWDRYGASDEYSSCWIRVAQPWAGDQFGFIHTPRIGQEVIVDFLNGDPDQPIITGRVYNADNMPPWSLPDNATQSGLLTRSSLEGSPANANALRFEDKKGQEELWMHAEKDQRLEVENDESHWVGHDRKKAVDNDENVTIGHNRTEEVGRDETITIGFSRTESVGREEIITVGGNRLHTVVLNSMSNIGLNRTVTVGLAKLETIGLASTLTVGQSRTTTIGSDSVDTIGKNLTLNVGADYKGTVQKNHSLTVNESQEVKVAKEIAVSSGQSSRLAVDKELHVTVTDLIKISCGDSVLIMEKNGDISLKGKNIIIETKADQKYKAGGEISLKGKKVLAN